MLHHLLSVENCDDPHVIDAVSMYKIIYIISFILDISLSLAMVNQEWLGAIIQQAITPGITWANVDPDIRCFYSAGWVILNLVTPVC